VKEPDRLKHKHAGTRAGALFDAARGEPPPEGAAERALSVLTLDMGRGRDLGTSAAKRVGSGKWIWGGMAAAIVAVGAAHELGAHRWFGPAAPSGRNAAAFSAVQRAPVSVRPRAEQEVPAPPSAEPPIATQESVPSLAPPSAADEHRRAASTRPKLSSLAREIAALDAVRRALADNDAARGLSLLRSYSRTFPRGELATEALVLRIEALIAAADRVGAERLARDYLQTNPSSHYRNKIGRILGALDSR
jgi:hypothetical protein